MDTFVAANYIVSLYDDGSFEVRIIKHFSLDVFVTYSPKNKKEPWAVDRETKVRAKSIGGLGLGIKDLKLLTEALEAIGKQDMIDNETEFKLKILEVYNSIKLAESEEGSKSEEGPKTDKRLWKCQFIRSSSILLSRTLEYTAVRELTTDEAINWHKNLVKQVNDNNRTTPTIYDGGLFYKKDNEWVHYEND